MREGNRKGKTGKARAIEEGKGREKMVKKKGRKREGNEG